MRNWFRAGVGQATRAVAQAVDPWYGSDGTYVRRVKREIEEIAVQLSNDVRVVHTRYNPERKCAELYVPGQGRLASINIDGDVCVSYQTIVWDSALSEEERPLFYTLPARVEFRDAF